MAVIAAVPTVTPSSPAIWGSSGSHTRRLAALANEASASSVMARVSGGTLAISAWTLSAPSGIPYRYGPRACLSSAARAAISG